MKQKRLLIDKNGPLIISDTVQAKTYPEILNTHCWILSNSTRKHPGVYALKQWELEHGKKPENMCILHKCDNINGPCVNPNHLFLGTMSDNIKDCILKERFNNGCTSSTAKKAWNTRVKNCNTTSFLTTPEKAKKSVETKKRNNINLGCTSEGLKKGWETRRAKNEGNGEKFVKAAKKAGKQEETMLN